MIDFLEQGHTMNGAYYAGELRRLRQEIARKRWGKVTRSDLLLLANAPTHNHKLPWLLWLKVDLKSILIPHILLNWLLLTSVSSQNWNPIFVLQVWKPWRRHRGKQRALGGPEKGLLFWRDKKARTALPWRGIILKSYGQMFIHTVLAYQIFNISRRKWKLWSAQGFHVLVQPREITHTENQADQLFLHTRHTCLPNNIKKPQQRMQVMECTSFRG